MRKTLILLSITLLLFSGCVQEGQQRSSTTEYKIVGGGGPYKEAIMSIHPQALDRELIRYAKGGVTFDVGLTPDQSRAYVANQVDGNITIISLDENLILDRFPAEKGVRVVKITPDGKTAYIAGNKKSYAYSAEPPYTLIKEIGAGGNTIAITPDGKRVFITGMSRQGLDVVDTLTNEVEKTIELPLTDGKAGVISMVVTPDGRELWAADALSGNMYVIDVATLTVKETIATEEGDPNLLQDFMASKKSFMQILASPDGKLVYAGGFSGNVRVFDTERYMELEPIPVNLEPKPDSVNKINGLAIDPEGETLFVSVINKNAIGVVSIETRKVLYQYSGVNAARIYSISAREKDGVKIEFEPSDKKGIPSGVDEADWKRARVLGFISDSGDQYLIEVNALGLRPNSVYTIWWRGRFGSGPLGGAPENGFITDGGGYGKAAVLIPKGALKDMDEFVILFHADNRTYGANPGKMGEMSFWHLVGKVPPL